MKKSLIYCASLLVILILSNALMSAQVNGASLTGLVSDSTGAVIQGAQVTVVNIATGVENSVSTITGYYTFPALPVGVYEVRVEKAGFRKAMAKVTLETAEKARQDFKLQVGAVTEQVTVVDSAIPILSKQDASPGTVIEKSVISQLPLSARNWDDLLGQVPGVQGDRYTEQGGGTASGRTGAVNVHGVRSLQNNFVLDGVDNNSFSENVQELTTQIVRPSVDAIEEFKVATNPYSAENGRMPGSLITVTTKNGTNSFHGLAYEYLRNKIFDANDYFTNRAGRERPKHVQNQFGAQLGGPIGKNHAFFFFNYEGTRIRKGRFYQANVPTASERAGDFSSAAAIANHIAGNAYATITDRVGDCRAKVPGAFNAS